MTEKVTEPYLEASTEPHAGSDFSGERGGAEVGEGRELVAGTELRGTELRGVQGLDRILKDRVDSQIQVGINGRTVRSGAY